MTTLWATPCQRTPLEPDWARAAPISPPMRACHAACRSRFRDRIALGTGGGFPAGVDRVPEPLVDVLPADDRDGVLARAEKFGDPVADEPVALVLERAQFAQLSLRVAETIELL